MGLFHQPTRSSTLTLAHRLGDVVVRDARGAVAEAFLRRVGDASLVLMGEATHGTHEFYRTRAELCRRLIREKGFNAIAVEADWPDAMRINRYVRGEGNANDPEAALRDFIRFPRWMWRNAEMLELIQWLRHHNDVLPPDDRVGFYGLDLYSLYRSMEEVLGYLRRADPAAAERAEERYACFERFGDEAHHYARGVFWGTHPSCQDEVVAQLIELQQRTLDGEELFDAVQNARVTVNAEHYYRTMMGGRVSGWNLRDQHMTDTLDALMAHLTTRFGRAKIAVWEHNSHVGDARATEQGEGGEWNVGQLTRERHGDDVVILGFTTHHGMVAAADNWDANVQHKVVRPALANSYEDAFHLTGIPSFAVVMQGEAEAALMPSRLERAIGVVYRPDSERASHYFHATLPRQFDVVIHFDETRAVDPLDRAGLWLEAEPAETYPSGL
ncbi:MAG: erythromycin esterase family protein [Myxococcota bacterium]